MFDLMNATLTPAASLPLFLYDEFFFFLLIYLSALRSSCRVSEESESHNSPGS